jgi:hypothetical protein
MGEEQICHLLLFFDADLPQAFMQYAIAPGPQSLTMTEKRGLRTSIETPDKIGSRSYDRNMLPAPRNTIKNRNVLPRPWAITGTHRLRQSVRK